MKPIINFFAIILFTMVVLSCTKQEDPVEKIDLPTITLKSPSLLKAKAGYERIELSWKLPFDPRVKEVLVLENGTTNPTTLPVNSNKEMSIILEASEGEHTYTITLIGEGELKSKPATITAKSYGKSYKESLRPIDIIGVVQDGFGAGIKWKENDTDECTSVLISYTDDSGEQKKLTFNANKLYARIPAFLKGSKFLATLMYSPEEDCLDEIPSASVEKNFPTLPDNEYVEILSKCSNKLLNTFNTNNNGWWDGTGWWNSANVLSVLIRYAEVTNDTSVKALAETVFNKNKQENFLNQFFDDEGWWGLAWVDAYQLYKEEKYLDMAKIIFDDMLTGWSDKWGGGIFWKKNPYEYKNAVTNGLFCILADRLYAITGDEKYYSYFENDIEWIDQSGMVNANFFVEDGLSNEDGLPTKDNNWTYNQGLFIGAYVRWYNLSKDNAFLETAKKIADATISGYAPNEWGGFATNGVLHERKWGEANMNQDREQFKGIFMRHLRTLYEATNDQRYKNFYFSNANSIIENNFNAEKIELGRHWQGPLIGSNSATISSGLDCVIEAYRFASVE